MSLVVPTGQKLSGAYYTPNQVVSSLVKWVVRSSTDRLLDPSCGDGRFIAAHTNSVGIEQDPQAAARAIAAAPWALVHEGDFFAWAANTHERFECAAGNPPFIRYQSFAGEVRQRALALCRGMGAEFTGLTSSWAPFLVAVTGLLEPGGRMAFVTPAEIGHAPYSAPVLEHLVSHFRSVHVVAVREKLFPDLSEDCWLLFAEGYGGSTAEIRFTALERFTPSPIPPKTFERVSVAEWRTTWNRRLRPYLMPSATRMLYRAATEAPGAKRLVEVAQVGIGYVSGANDFFHLRPSEVARWKIPRPLLLPSVRNGRSLRSKEVNVATLEAWRRNDEPYLLLRLEKSGELPTSVRRYLDTEAAHEAKAAYKCRVRDPWWSVPDVRVPSFFLTYMSGTAPGLVRNQAEATCTNSVHAVTAKSKSGLARLATHWETPIVRLSCEVEGHPLGGGMLKLEPREAGRILVPSSSAAALASHEAIAEAVSVFRRWRHHVVTH